MHSHAASFDVDRFVNAEPVRPAVGLQQLMKLCLLVGILTLSYGLTFSSPAYFWAAYYHQVVFWMGIACGSVAFVAILQIVRATWAPPIRRIAEAGVSFFPWAYITFVFSYFGKEHIFYWGSHPAPGKEWWMQPDFVYGRFLFLLGLLFFFMWRFVRLSIRSDVGYIQEHAKGIDRWFAPVYQNLVGTWGGSAVESKETQRKLSFRAPAIILVYAVVISLFAFDMIMAMDKYWFSNMFGGFIFISNIQVAIAVVILTATHVARINRDYASILTNNHLWDLGKLLFGFTMLWGYLFFSQFLVQWYGNLPEETQWLILRTREMPWKTVGWITFGLCFVIPFIILLSRDVKKTVAAASIPALLIFVGGYLDRYVIIMPQISPSEIPFGLLEIGLFLGFLGTYVLSVQSFLAKYPCVPLSSPQIRGQVDW